MFCDPGCPCAKEQGLPGGWEDRAEPSYPSGCTWCEVAAYPASPSLWSAPVLDLVPAWQQMGWRSPAARLRAPSSGGSTMNCDVEGQG